SKKLNKAGIETPRFMYLYKGETLSIGYFDFNDNDFVSIKDIEAEAARMSMILYHIPINILGEIIPEYLFNYKKYSRSFSIEKEEIAVIEFEKEAIPYDKIENRIESGRWVLTHGGLKYGHLYKSGMLIDWDEFGIYPAGLEQAYIYF